MPVHSIEILIPFQGNLYNTENRHKNLVAYNKNVQTLRLNSFIVNDNNVYISNAFSPYLPNVVYTQFAVTDTASFYILF